MPLEAPNNINCIPWPAGGKITLTRQFQSETAFTEHYLSFSATKKKCSAKYGCNGFCQESSQLNALNLQRQRLPIPSSSDTTVGVLEPNHLTQILLSLKGKLGISNFSIFPHLSLLLNVIHLFLATVVMLLICKQILAKKYKSNIQISDLIFQKNTIKFM